MNKIKVTLDEVLGDDTDSQFWRSIMSNPEYPNFIEDLNHIIDQSVKHGKRYSDIDPRDIDGYVWKLK